jgi:hypothetical protein
LGGVGAGRAESREQGLWIPGGVAGFVELTCDDPVVTPPGEEKCILAVLVEIGGLDGVGVKKSQPVRANLDEVQVGDIPSEHGCAGAFPEDQHVWKSVACEIAVNDVIGEGRGWELGGSGCREEEQKQASESGCDLGAAGAGAGE